MQSKLNSLLKSDVRLEEGLTACMNCGICTAICPAAEYFEYDPRSIAVTVQSGNEEEIATSCWRVTPFGTAGSVCRAKPVAPETIARG